MSRPRAYQLIEAAATAERVSTNVDKLKSEGQVRPLTSVPKEQQAAVWKVAVETAQGSKVTGRHVSAVVASLGRKRNEVEFNEDTSGLRLGSQAMYIAETAIAHLKGILKSDPERFKAIRHVIEYCNKILKEDRGK